VFSAGLPAPPARQARKLRRRGFAETEAIQLKLDIPRRSFGAPVFEGAGRGSQRRLAGARTPTTHMTHIAIRDAGVREYRLDADDWRSE
jgi:hypothetical protein